MSLIPAPKTSVAGCFSVLHVGKQMPRIVEQGNSLREPMTHARLTLCHRRTSDNNIMTVKSEPSDAVDSGETAPTIRRVIERSPARHRLNLLFVLWPPVIHLLDCVARRLCHECPDGQGEELLSRAIMTGLKAADGVKGYSEPAWPMRVVDAFMEGTQSFVAERSSMPCPPGEVLCGAHPYCRSAGLTETADDGTSAVPLRLKSVRGSKRA